MTNTYLDPEFVDLSPEQIERVNQDNKPSPEKVATATLIPREYQYEIFKKAVSENTIAVLDTGAGKTLIAVMLIKHMLAIENEKLQANKDYKKKVTFFLVDRVHLVFQQASVIRANCDARVKELCGDMNVDAWKADRWTEIWDANDICVLTAQIFLDNLQSGFLTLDRVNLMIFDECHHASKGHPFNLIMIGFYHRIYDNPVNQALDKPKIFGMTASPIHTSSTKVLESIKVLETSLNSLVYTAKSTKELTSAVKKPFEIELFYSMPVINDVPPSPMHAARDFIRPERYQRSILTTIISSKIEQVPGFQQCLNAIIYISNNLGPWCSDRLWKSILYKANTKGLFTPTLYTPQQKLSRQDRQRLQEAYNLCPTTPNAISDPDLNNEYLFTPKARVLVDCLKDILANDANKKDFCGIIFVDRRHTAAAIKILIESLSVFREDIRCDVLIGHGARSGGDLQMKYTEQNEVISKFRAGELNLLIATNVAEEGLDIQACNYVIRFDLFKTVIAYIQSRGRARRQDSKYILMLNRQNLKDVGLLRKVMETENHMKNYCRMLPKDRNLAVMFDQSESLEPEYIKQALSDQYLQGVFPIESTGALLTRFNAIALIYHYCATLPSDNFCNFKPVYKYEDLTNNGLSLQEIKALDLPPINANTITGGRGIFGCTLTLPINARIQQFKAYDRTKDDAKARVSLQACIALYKAGDIDSHLVPKSKSQRKLLMEMEEEVDENGKLVGSRGREDLYKKKMPSFWQGDIESDEQARLGPYWLSLIGIDSSVQQQQQQAPLYRPMCLITKKPLPAIPNITLYNDNIPFQVHLTSQPVAVSFNKQKQVDDLMVYTFCFLECIINKSFSCAKSNIEYLVAPLKVSTDASDQATQQAAKIDWDEITKTVTTTDSNSPVKVYSNSVLDTIVIDASDPKRRQYFVQRVQHDMTPMSSVPEFIATSDGCAKKLREKGYTTFKEYYEDQEYLSNKITDATQPLIQVKRVPKIQSFQYRRGSKLLKKRDREPESVVHWLVPELCQPYPISASVYQTLQLVPDIMTRIDAVLLLHDAKTALGLSNKIKDSYMLEAFTASSAGLEKDYQRLEFLGDSVLKFITSTYVFATQPVSNEFELTESRMRMISNKALFKSAIKLELHQYVCSQHLPRRFWRPPNYTCKDDSAEMIKSLTYHKLSDKTLADVVESTLGASYLSCLHENKGEALNEALHTAQRLLVPLQQMDQWSDFQKVYREARASKQLEIARYDPLFDQRVNLKKVSRILGYEFQNESLIAEALTHASVTNSSVPCYQRLEFLGDAVLDFCVTQYLFEKYHTAPPGILHDLRKSSVNNDILSVLCIQLELHVHIRHFSTNFPLAVEQFQELLAASQDRKDEYWLNFNPPKVLSDVVESLIGAVFVDAGFNLDPVKSLFDRLLKPLLDDHISIETIQQHPLGKLKCLVQEFGCKQCETRNVYTAKLGQCCVIFIHGQAFASGSGVNTKEARKEAAAKACQRIQDHPDEFIAKCTCR